ncbi:c-type cytochrome, partial [Mesorhizobium sp. M4A.F.Ca.ET.090.04.2.1]
MAWLKKLVGAALVLGGAGAVAAWLLSAPVRLDAATVAQLGPGDAARGKRIFYAGGCTSCHAKPGSQGDARLALTGGLELKTPFGTFVPPNISQDAKDGIGAWSEQDFADAMLKGVSPSGEHFY